MTATAKEDRKVDVTYSFPDNSTGARLKADTVPTSVTFKFVHGPEYTFDSASFNPGVIGNMLWMGIRTKLSNAYAAAKTSFEAEERLVGLVEQIGGVEGVWTEKAEGVAPIGALAEALFTLKPDKYGPDLAAARAAVEKMTKEERGERRKHPKVKATINSLRQARLDKAAAEATTETL